MINFVLHLACEVYFKGVSTVFPSINQLKILRVPLFRFACGAYFHRISTVFQILDGYVFPF